MTVESRDLGVMPYKECWDLQQSLFDALMERKTAKDRGAGEVAGKGKKEPEGAAGNEKDANEGSGSANDAGTILMVEHPPVYTLGKSGHAENLLIGREALERMGAEFFHIDRGGDITFHGPGQLVCYPILDLEGLGIGLRAYIEALEEAVIRTVAHYGIAAGRIEGASGVWVAGAAPKGGAPENGAAGMIAAPRPPRKICAIGVRSSRYITMHGFALNVTTDLGWFARINPCGFTDRGVTSIAAETGREVDMSEIKTLVMNFLEKILNVKIYNK